MKINILHLYRNLMNLYGEYANIKVLVKHLEDQGVEVELVEAEKLSEVELGDFDFVYIGSGTELKQKQALEDFISNNEKFIEYAEQGKPALLTGNAFEMLGKSITDSSGKSFNCIGIADFTTTEQSKKRLTSDAVAECRFLANDIVGFINKCSTISGIAEPINTMKLGLGNDNEASGEGMRYKNIIGTHFIGPVLVKNPELMKYMLCLICEGKDKGFTYKPVDYPYEASAYQITLEKLTERITNAN